VIFGAGWLVIEPAGLFFPSQLDWGWPGYLSLVGVGALAALYASRPRREVSHSLPPSDITVAVKVGDVLAQQGNIVVGANDTFDTEIDNDIISPRSVQGQLLAKCFSGNRAELDRQIAEALRGAQGVEDNTKTFGKTTRYDVGTVATVRQGQSRFFLIAFTRMSSTLPANVASSIEELQMSLARTWSAIAQAGQREPVHLPILGSNLARLGVSRTLLIQMILLSFIAAETRGRVASSVTVYVSPDDWKTVDMAALDDWLRGLCAH
jgi:hypothetical protein